MRRNAITRVSKAKALTAPEPEFVSMVRAGANQEPLRAVKMDMASEIAGLFATTEISMKEALEKARKSGRDIAQLVFKGGEFADRPTVDAWLKDGGYDAESYEVTEKKDGDVTEFTVASKTLKFKTGSIKKVKGQVDGLFVFVGEVEGGATPAAKTEQETTDEAAAAKGSTVATKDDGKPEGAEAKEKTETAAEPAAPAATVAPDAETTQKADLELRTKSEAVVGELRQKSMYDVSSLGSVLSTLRWMVYDAEYNSLPDDAVQSIKTGAKSLLEALVSAMNEAVGDYVEAFKADTTFAAKTEEVAPVADTTATDPAATTQKSAETPAAPAAEAAAPAAFEMPAELVATLKALGDGIATLTASVKEQGEAIADVKQKSEKADAERQEQGQSRKGADVVDPTATPAKPDETAKKTEDAAQRRLRSALGFQRI